MRLLPNNRTTSRILALMAMVALLTPLVAPSRADAAWSPAPTSSTSLTGPASPLAQGLPLFGAPTSSSTGASPASVATGDFNGDGQLDLVTANWGSNNVSVLLGTGTATFDTATHFAGGSGPKSVAVGDFNGDGKPDLVIAKEGGDNVSVLLSQSSGTPKSVGASAGATTITLTGGALTFGSFAGLTLSGAQQTSTATWSLANVVDARGTGAGWNLSVTLAPLKEVDAASQYVAGGKSLPTSSIRVTTPPTITLTDPTSSPASTVTPIAANTALDTASTVKLLSAGANGGMGSYAFGTMTVGLKIPAAAFARAYKSEATVSRSTGH